MINTCCNLYFYYNFIVHGGIRHLEIFGWSYSRAICVHGGIRHLEKVAALIKAGQHVHGGIRHLEILVNLSER